MRVLSKVEQFNSGIYLCGSFKGIPAAISNIFRLKKTKKPEMAIQISIDYRVIP